MFFVYVLYFIATMSFAGYFLPVLCCMLSMLISDSRFDLVWFRLSCDHGWIRSGSVNVRKQQQQQLIGDTPHHYHPALWSLKDLPISPRFTPYDFLSRCKFNTLTTRQPMVDFFTYSRSHAFRYERKNTNPTLVGIELTTSALAGVQVTY